VLRAQAAGANLDPQELPVLNDRLVVDVGPKEGFGAPLGVADVIASHPALVTNLASHGLLPVLSLCWYSLTGYFDTQTTIPRLN
jgi:hypothetical protein